MRVATVLRTGGDFKTGHVKALHRQIERWLPGVEVFCLTNVGGIEGANTQPLRFLWPGWWSKMELFAPWVGGDLLFLDLDTVVLGPLDDIAAVRTLTLMRDAYRPDGLQSSIMLLPEADREAVWSAWMKSPQEFIRQQKGGDQGFLETLWLRKAARWQDVLPGRVVSYKVDIRKKGDKIPADARLVAFHGKPRPWALDKGHPLYKAAGYS